MVPIHPQIRARTPASHQTRTPVPTGVGSERWTPAFEVRDGTNVVFESTDWTNPGEPDWAVPPHHVFSGPLGYTCEYTNTTSQPLQYGESFANETCLVVAYFFPATRPALCINSMVLP